MPRTQHLSYRARRHLWRARISAKLTLCGAYAAAAHIMANDMPRLCASIMSRRSAAVSTRGKRAVHARKLTMFNSSLLIVIDVSNVIKIMAPDIVGLRNGVSELVAETSIKRAVSSPSRSAASAETWQINLIVWHHRK